MHTARSPSHVRHALLTGMLAGDREAQRRFVGEFTPMMTGLARKIAADLPSDLRDDIVQEAFAVLLARPSAYDPAKGSADAFVGMAVWDAGRRVRSSYTPPGRKTRHENERGKASTPIGATPRRFVGGDGPEAILSVVPLDQVIETTPATQDEIALVEAKLDAARVMAQARGQVAMTLRLVHWQEQTVQAAADASGISRTTLLSRLNTFFKVFRKAA